MNLRYALGGAALLSCVTTQAVENFIAGDVHATNGKAEAGVWVIAETDALPTPYRKIVVTDQHGKFVLPQLPAAKYRVWVRGYGLNDSTPVEAARGANLSLKVERAADAAEAARVYPASDWLTLFEPPPPDAFGQAAHRNGKGGLFGGKDDPGDDPFKSQTAWLAQLKLNCVLCHPLGSAVTHQPDAASFDHGFMKAAAMNYFADTLGRPRLLGALAAWTARIAEREAPLAPPRPSGLERNVVITQWAWGDG